MRKYQKCCVLALGMIAASLAGCNNNPESSSSSSEPASSTSIPKGDIYIEASVKKNKIPNGANFFDFCKPTVTFHEKAKDPMDVTNHRFMTDYDIFDATGNHFGAGDPLPAGHYTAGIEYKTRYYEEVNFEVEEVAPETASEGHGYKTYTTEDLAQYTYKNYRDIDTLGGGCTPSKGNTKILVIPVQFGGADGAKFDDPNTPEDEGELARQVIHEAFFDDGENTPWESLASYYKKSSFNKQNITGEVTEIYTYNKSDRDSSIGQGIATTIAADAVSYFKREQKLNASDYDSDGDGFIDGVEIIYVTNNPTPSSYGTNESDPNADTWWNYCTNTGLSADTRSPNPKRMFWSRYDYLTQKYYAASEKGILVNEKKVDPHTIIHETGHMMGAPDYYDYSHQSGPAGCVDMMDCNVGDHNAYTKMHYNWVAPMVVDGSSDNFNLTLHSFGETGEFVLLRNTVEDPWNETPFDEYLVLQYYTPTNLNEMDKDGYGEWLDGISSSGDSAYGHAGTYAHPGLQVFHADGRVYSEIGSLTTDPATGRTVKGTAKPTYTDDPKTASFEDAENGIYGTAAKRSHCNTSKDEPARASAAIVDGNLTIETDVRELSIITPSGVASFSSSSYTNSMGYMANLFGLNGVNLDGWTGDPTKTKGDDKFGGSSYSNYKMRGFYPNGLSFNDGSTLNWSFEVVAQTTDSITIHFINSAA